jgi:hypothetical protein
MQKLENCYYLSRGIQTVLLWRNSALLEVGLLQVVQTIQIKVPIKKFLDKLSVSGFTNQGQLLNVSFSSPLVNDPIWTPISLTLTGSSTADVMFFHALLII